MPYTSRLRRTTPRRDTLAWLCGLTTLVVMGCSGTQSVGPVATGGNSASGGSTSSTSVSGGASASGGTIAPLTSSGTTAAGGTAATSTGATAGGAVSTGGTTSTASGNATGGLSTTGGAATVGSVPTGGTRSQGGAFSGGTPSTGGVSATGGKSTGGSTTGGSVPEGGSQNTGGATPTGGAATGGAAAGGSTSSDRCDVGVYDSANPPKVLTLSGNLGAHDPSAILQTNNDTYYEFQTGLGAKTSTNLTSWSAASAPFTAPSWMKSNVPGVGDLWAPDISYFNGQYHLYYAGSTFGSNRSCIGHATRTSLSSGSWSDQGAVICSNVDSSDNWNAIDPNVVIDTDGTPWLDFGSFWSGIKLVQLDANGARAGTETPTALAARPNNGGAIEGPYIVRRCGYYYLFTSWDTCCQGADSTYNIRVVRSTSVSGPYVDKNGTSAISGGGTLMAQGNGNSWAGPGGQSVLISGTKAYLVYHAYAMSNGAAALRIADLVWDSSGWPMPVGP